MSSQNFDPDWAKHLKHDPDRPLAVDVPEPSTTWDQMISAYRGSLPQGPENVDHDEERRPKTKGQERGDLSKTYVNITVKIYRTDESVQMSCQTCTTISEVAERLGWKAGADPFSLEFVQKKGCSYRIMSFHEEVARHMTVKGLRSFKRQKMKYDDPKVIIGSGHCGLRMAMFLVERKEYDFVVFDRMFRVGGTSWMYQANSTSKLQTEYGAYHLHYGENYPLPTDFSTPWPSRNALLDHFEKTVNDYGIMPYIRLNTNVKAMEPLDRGKQFQGPAWYKIEKYQLTVEKMSAGRLRYGKVVHPADDAEEQEEEQFYAASICQFPGNLTIPRMETYKGEELFDGDIGYAMFNEIDYHKLAGLNCTILGHGAFAVENIRTCVEFEVSQIYLVCRRKNLSCPRVCSWMANRSIVPLNNSRFMKCMEPMYKFAGYDPWAYYSVQANEKRTTCQITQKARFGIGDIYFLAIYMGKVEVVVDPGGVKRLARHEVICAGGRRLHCQGFLKLLGLVGEMDIDRLMKVKEMVGFWVNGDPRRYLVAEPVSVMCTQIGGTSFSPGAYAWSIEGLYFLDYPWDFDGPLSSGMLPKHSVDVSDDGTPRPAYVVDARHGTTTAMAIGMFTPGLQEFEGSAGYVKAVRFRLCHPIRKFLAQAKEDWDHYAQRMLDEGFGVDKPYPEYPYTVDVVKEMYKRHKEDSGEPELPCDSADLAICNA